jgi:hypothetical protein
MKMEMERNHLHLQMGYYDRAHSLEIGYEEWRGVFYLMKVFLVVVGGGRDDRNLNSYMSDDVRTQTRILVDEEVQ